MSLIIDSSRLGSRSNWRLGPAADPGWFDTSGTLAVGHFLIVTAFRLCWQFQSDPPDGIYNMLHAVTIGRSSRAGKVHLEQLAQILQKRLHVTCRITDSTGQVHRNTVALAGDWQQYQNRNLLLIYTGNMEPGLPAVIETLNLLYDRDSLDLLQCLPHRVPLASAGDVDFSSWERNQVVCDHEQQHRHRDHVMVHGFCNDFSFAHVPFEICHIWSSLGQTLDATDLCNIKIFSQASIPDTVATVNAWYNCGLDRTVLDTNDRWAICTGRYRQTRSLGIQTHIVD